MLTSAAILILVSQARMSSPVDTQKRILMWAEFTCKVARGVYGLETKLKDVGIEGFNHFFGRTDWRVQDLFSLGNVALRPRIKEVALGSLLHTVEDRFAKGHVDRGEAILGEKCSGADYPGPGQIREFHAYGNQDAEKHGEYDSRQAFSGHWTADRPTVVAVGQVLRGYYERGSS